MQERAHKRKLTVQTWCVCRFDVSNHPCITNNVPLGPQSIHFGTWFPEKAEFCRLGLLPGCGIFAQWTVELFLRWRCLELDLLNSISWWEPFFVLNSFRKGNNTYVTIKEVYCTSRVILSCCACALHRKKSQILTYMFTDLCWACIRCRSVVGEKTEQNYFWLVHVLIDSSRGLIQFH